MRGRPSRQTATRDRRGPPAEHRHHLHVDHGSRPWPTASWSSPTPSTRGTCASSTSTRWTWSASGGSPSSSRASASGTATTSSTSSTRPVTSTSATRCRGRSPPARGDPPGRRVPGHRGPDPRHVLAGPRARPRDRRRPEQDRPGGRRARPPRRGDRTGPRHRRRRRLRISAKTGEGVEDLLNAVVDRVPAPRGDGCLRALVFDSHFDQYRGVIGSVRVMDGALRSGSRIRLMQSGAVRR